MVAARQAIAFLPAHDVPIASLLSRAGVSESDIDNRQRRIAAMAQGKILEYAAETLGDSEFGLHLAQSVTHARSGCFSMSPPPPRTLAMPWRSPRAIAASSTRRCVQSSFGLGKG